MRTSLTEAFADAAAHLGISRPAGQCFAAIWMAEQPLCADDLTGSLGLSRSNVSTALKELREWNLIAASKRPGDRKEYLTAPDDPWEMLRLVLAGRYRRGFAPLLDRLLDAEAELADARIAALHEMVSGVSDWMGGLAAEDAGRLARHITGRTAGEDDPHTKKKKKKKK